MFVIGREELPVDLWLAASATVDDGKAMSKVRIPSGAVPTGTLNGTRGTGTRVYGAL